jgi:capsular exopolysaccharide synthesis family protein
MRNENLSWMEGADFGDNKAQSFDITKVLFRLLRRWPYILAFLILSVSCGLLVNRYMTPIYSVSSRITTKKFSNKPSSLVPGMVDASFFLSGLTEVYEEIPILKSPARIEAALRKVDFRVSYYSKGLIKTVERATGLGFAIRIDSILDEHYPSGIPIFVNHVSATEFKLVLDNDFWKQAVEGQTFQFGSPLKLGNAWLTISNTNGKTSAPDQNFFVLNRMSSLVAKYRDRLDITWSMKGSSMLDLYMESNLPETDLQFMNAFFSVVAEKGLEEKNETLENTIAFIDEQMEWVSDSLDFYQTIIDSMKLRNRDVSGGTDIIYKKLDDLEDRRAEVMLNERYLDYLVNYFEQNATGEVFAPSLIGLQVPLLEDWVSQFIKFKLTEKNYRFLENSQNPLVNREDSLKRKLVKGIFEAVKSERLRNKEVLADLQKKENLQYTSIGNVQGGIRDLERYQRLFKINYDLFDLLIKRKTEAAISKASATSDYKIIEEPVFSSQPIKPDKAYNLLAAAGIGLVLPILFFLFRDFTNSTVRDKDELEFLVELPLLGNIAHSSYEANLVVEQHPRSVVAESFRAVRANIKYLTARTQEGAQVLVVTSAIGGEGKTFCSINLAYTLALSNKKVIMVGADLRKPQLSNYLKRFPQHGLSTYLAGYASIQEIILKGEGNVPDFIDSGSIPPNPAELLGNELMEKLMAYLKTQYDYVVIDTPPIGLVADAMDLFKFSNYNILIVRQSVTPKAALKMVNELFMGGKIPNFLTLFNDIELIKRGGSYYGHYLYGMGYSGYGFGYYEEDSEKNGKRKKKKKDN